MLKIVNVLDKGFVELIDILGDDNTIVSAARVSVLGESKGKEKDKQLIKYLLDNKHTSPFEHVVFTFRVKCPLFVRSQWMRHRTWSYNEVSRRYTSEDIDFYIPKVLRKQAKSNRQASVDEYISTLVDEELDVNESVTDFISVTCGMLQDTYEFLLKQGVSREQARMVLPQNMYTMFYATVDLHNLFHFIELRNTPEAQYEIRVYAEALERMVAEQVPWAYEAWKTRK